MTSGDQPDKVTSDKGDVTFQRLQRGILRVKPRIHVSQTLLVPKLSDLNWEKDVIMGTQFEFMTTY